MTAPRRDDPSSRTRRTARPGSPKPRPAGPRFLAGPWIARLALPLVLLAVVAVHAPALDTFFASDDVTFLARARGLEPDVPSLARWLSGTLRWKAMLAVFGLDPWPWHAAALALHLVNTALVWRIGRRLLPSSAAAVAAATIFGVSSIAFTALHWASGFGELMVTAFALAATELHWSGRETRSGPRIAFAVIAAIAALLSKESALLLPLVLLAVETRSGVLDPRPRSVWPAAIAAALFAAAFVATLGLVPYLGGAAYSMTIAPRFLLENLATYLWWGATPAIPVRDAVAVADPRALGAGLGVAAAIVVALWLVRRGARHPEEVGAVWFAAFLLPVLPLAHHTYLYYLYLPWAGASWLLAGFGERLVRRAGTPGAALAAIALVALVTVEFRAVRARESAMTGDFPADRVERESRMLRRALGAIDSTALPPHAAVAFVNPAPQRHTALAAGSGHRYVPLEAALRDGRALEVFTPGLRYRGFHATLTPALEDAEAFLYQDDGSLRHLGRGSQALAGLGYFALRLEQWGGADSLFRRTLARGDTLPDAVFGLGVTNDLLGRAVEGRAWATEFLRRWPEDPRAEVVRRAFGMGAKN